MCKEAFRPMASRNRRRRPVFKRCSVPLPSFSAVASSGLAVPAEAAFGAATPFSAALPIGFNDLVTVKMTAPPPPIG